MNLPVAREMLRRFWEAVPVTASVAAAGEVCGVSPTTAMAWFREAGGVSPSLVVPAGRYLSFAEREEIAVGLACGHSIRAIARSVGRPASTISREVRRNDERVPASRQVRGHPRRGRPPCRPPQPYRAGLAQRRADARASRPKQAKLAGTPALRSIVEEQLAQGWSPEQISLWLDTRFPDDAQMQVSHESIYQALYVQGRGALRRELAACLRTGRALRKPHRRADKRIGRIPNMVMICDRPAEVTDRAVPGHWEGDLIIGANSASAIGTLVERSTRFCLLLHLPVRHGAEEVRDAMLAKITELPAHLWRSLTWDQGIEMAKHRDITVATGIPIYFCDPASPWQRGSNENTNGLLRQYFPKGTDLSVHTAEHLDTIAAKLNGRPRKTLNIRTPAEALNELLSTPFNPPGVATTA